LPPVIRALQHAQAALGCEARTAGLIESSTASAHSESRPDDILGAILGPPAFGYSPELKHALQERLASGDIVHVHGLWMYPGLLGRQLSGRLAAKRLISPHGMLEPWALQNSRGKKRLAAWLFEDRNLRSADCLQALCAAEAEHFRRYGLRNPIAVIPNGVDPHAFANPPDRSVLEARFPALRARRWILSLSRIHPKKGLLHLLQAWKAVGAHPAALSSALGPLSSDWVLVIAGPDEIGHESQLRQRCRDLGLESNVVFTGPLHGADKLAALGHAELFVLPSFSEGFSLAALEAAAAGLPVLLTPQCNFPELAKAGGAIEVAPDAAACEAGLKRMLTLPEAERRAMGRRAQHLVTQAYTWPRIAEELLGVYQWLIQGGPPPGTVRLPVG
jgi:glycosyltransferase involved in cell wall biosynthesis